MVVSKSPEEHRFTSTGIKFWRHQDQMQSYREGTGNTIVATHISPEGACNLRCSYCSVSKRKTSNRIPLEVIQDYVTKLQTRGLRGVILTGGGEPTLYPHANELVHWLADRRLDIGLITNGTLTDRLDADSWAALSWARMSINDFNGWEDQIKIPFEDMRDSATIGASLIYVGQSSDELKAVAGVVRRSNGKYVRLLPDCNLPLDELRAMHDQIDQKMAEVKDPLFFHQHKMPRAPDHELCHQAYFRPYLSEVDGGTVYPCDSLVLNGAIGHFDRKYALCAPGEILDFLDGKIVHSFDPRSDCSGCVFTDNLDLLGGWKEFGEGRFNEFREVLKDENFP